MKRVLVIAGVAYFMLVLVVLMVAGGAGGSSSGTNLPIFYIITDTDADSYQRVCVPLELPWEIPIMLDALDGCEQGDDDMRRYESRFTVLHFCVIEEDKYIAKKVPADSEEAQLPQPQLELLALDVNEEYFGNEEGGNVTPPSEVTPAPEESAAPEASAAPTSEPTTEPTPEPTEEPVEMVTIWVLEDTDYYEGRSEILKYVEAVGCDSMDTLQEAVTQAAKEKSDEDVLYRAEVKMLEIADYETFLEGLNLGKHIDIECVMDIYRDGYLIELFGDGSIYIPPEPTATPEPT